MGKTAFLFPGQGAQHVGMGRRMAAEFPAARALFDRSSELLGFDLLKLCSDGPQSELDRTDISQPALFVTSLAALEMLKVQNPAAVDTCSYAAGLSLGEYTALVFAGAMSFEDGLRVVQVRGRAMQAAAEATPSGMVSLLLLDVPAVEKVVAEASAVGRLQIANFLCPGNIVVSGEKAACEKAAEIAEGSAGGRAVALSVAGAFHTDIMKPADEKLAAALDPAKIRSPRIPVISNVDAASHTDPDDLRRVLVRQVLSPVRWEESVRALIAAGVDTFYEVGPGKVLKGLMKRIDRKRDCLSVNDS
jgi:[acyl-carrier-protein] S-malonyltransferase